MARTTRRAGPAGASAKRGTGAHSRARLLSLAPAILAAVVLAGALLIASAVAAKQSLHTAAGAVQATAPLASSPLATNVSGGPIFAAEPLKAPEITKQPVSTTVVEGQNAVFEATATGNPAPTVQWEVSTIGGGSWSQIAKATKTVLTVKTSSAIESGREYRAVFKNSQGTVTSNAATLTIETPPEAPSVIQQPVSEIVEEGHTAGFVALARGNPEPTVQWELSTDGGKTFSPVPGATSVNVSVASPTIAESGDEYRAVFKNKAGQATSAPATLTVDKLPAVTQQPVGLTVEEGQGAAFEAAANGFPAPTVQWERSTDGGKSWSEVAGATSAKLSIASTLTTESGNEYRAAFKNLAGTVRSEAATLTVQKRPTVIKQPFDTTVNEGQSAVFEAVASGFPAPTVQWQVSTDGGGTWNAIPGAISNKLTVPAVTLSESGWQYRAVFSNAAGEATSAAAKLTVYSPPVISEQPASTIVEAGASAEFEASATGVPAPTVQWERSTDGGKTWSEVAGAKSDKLTIPTTMVSENGNEYRAVFTNAAGKATSAPATLTVATTHYQAVAWGQGTYGQLGDGSAESSSLPEPVTGLHFVTSVSAGKRFSLALRADGTVLAWGNNASGQLGDESLTSSAVPVTVKGISGVKAIAAGGNFGLALMSNGTVMAWGENEAGQLGTGNTSSSEVPVPVKGLSNVKAISAGNGHSLALLNNGNVMAWGENENGELGTGNTKSSDVPVTVKGVSGATAISAGGNFSLAVVKGAAVKAWGSDEQGQLGQEPPEEGFIDSPVEVGSFTEVTAVAAGANHALALLGNGTVMAWGEDHYGELGNGVIKNWEETPVAVSGLSGVTAISAGGQDSVALLANGSVMTWGIDKYGNLGNAETGGFSDVPVAVIGLAKAASVSAGSAHMLAYGEPIPTVAGVTPNLGPIPGGGKVVISGVDLTGATGVTFGTKAALSYNVTSATTVEAVAPAGTGTVDVKVTTPSGTSPPVPADHYTYEPTPTVTALSKTSGPVAGGTTVNITGTEFVAVANVKFGGVAAAEFKVNSPTSITAVSPPDSAGAAAVTVINAGGTSALTSKDVFTFTPTVETVTPATGPRAGGTHVTVTGTGFIPGATGTTFKFGKKKASAVSCESSTSCTMTSPPEAAGTANVTALVNKAKSPTSPADQFTYT